MGARRRAVLEGVDGQQIAGFRQVDITRTVHFLNGVFRPVDGHGGLAVKFRFVRHIQVVGRYLDSEGNCAGSAVVFPVDHRECVFARLHRDLQKLRLQRQGKRFVCRTADCQETGSRRDVHFAVQEDFGKFPALAVDGETQGVPAALVPGLAVALGNRPGVQLSFQPNQLVKLRAVHQGLLVVGQVAVGLPGGLDLGILHGLLVRLHGIRQGIDLSLYRRHLVQNLTQLRNPSQCPVNFLLFPFGGIGHIQTLEGRFHIVQGGTVGFANCVFQNAVQGLGQVGKGLHVHGDGGLVAAPVSHREGIGTTVVWQPQLDRILISAIRNHSD